jgi:hypothetical protein
MLKFKDPRAPAISNSYSQISQDLFVVAMTRGLLGGSFLEIGASDPRIGNNTYLLESQFNYRGISVERITPDYENFFVEWYQSIKLPEWPHNIESFSAVPDWLKSLISQTYPVDNYARYHDTKAEEDRNKLSEVWLECRPNSNLITKDAFDLDYRKLPNFITYLQIDIDPPADNLQILKKICQHIRFAVITFEHDYYLNSPGSTLALTESRKLLSSQGYRMIADKIDNFEDWWVDPNHIDSEIYEYYEMVNNSVKSSREVLFD